MYIGHHRAKLQRSIVLYIRDRVGMSSPVAKKRVFGFAEDIFTFSIPRRENNRVFFPARTKQNRFIRSNKSLLEREEEIHCVIQIPPKNKPPTARMFSSISDHAISILYIFNHFRCFTYYGQFSHDAPPPHGHYYYVCKNYFAGRAVP